MQLRAKERQKAKKFTEDMMAYRQEFSQAIEQLGDRVSFSNGTAFEILAWSEKWAEEYTDEEKGSRARPIPLEYAQDIEKDKNFWFINLDDEPVGYMLLKTKSFNQKPVLGIEIIYILPEHRGQHLATMGYLYAVDNVGAKWIELSYDRIKARPAYWASLGFIWIAGSPSPTQNDGTIGSIGILSQVDHPVGIVITPDNIYKARKSAEEHCQKLVKTA
jgi:hypothetical protein